MYSKIFLAAGLLAFVLANATRSPHASEEMGWLLIFIAIAIACVNYLVNRKSITKQKEIKKLEAEVKALELKKRKQTLEEELG